jgi:formylglycine-generating enzyme required for sulfatase activity
VEASSPIVAVPVPAPDGRGVAFFLGRTPVSNAQYAPFLATGRVPAPPWWSDPDFAAPDQPVVGVSWDEAAAFAAWLAEFEGGAWRLPGEAEWEFAASGGLDAPATSWGDAIPEGEVPAGPLVAPWPVGRGTPNGYGLCDMGTIVHEWCLDWSRPGRRASRGGSWRHAIRWSSPRARSSLPPSLRYSDYGFRVLREAASKNFDPRKISGTPAGDRVL